MTAAFSVELRGLRKSFGDVVANAGVNLRVRKGTIHAIIGENGAGKSTAMKMLYGMIRPDAGEILIDGAPRKWSSARDAIACGIGMVHQHFMLAGPYTALDNVILGSEKGFLKPLPRKKAREELEGVCRSYGFKIDWNTPVEDLSVGIQQRIEIVKLLYRKAEILILDEPTAVLAPQEAQELFKQLKKLAAEGKSILIITHKLKEVMLAADHVTVFRQGRVVGDVPVADESGKRIGEEALASLMVGKKMSLGLTIPPQVGERKPILEVKGVSLRNDRSEREILHDVSFTIHSGEIVGIAGVEGNGQPDLLQVLLHPNDFSSRLSGEIRVFGKDAASSSAFELRASGMSVIPEDRHHEGLLLAADVGENYLLGLQRRAPFFKSGFISGRTMEGRASRAITEYDVRPPSLKTIMSGLSGGNQQKLIIAREFESSPKFLVAAQPTRGVDVGAIQVIHQRILRARAEGVGILLVSSELDEILALSDKILVMCGGKVTGEFARGECDEKILGLRMCGVVSA